MRCKQSSYKVHSFPFYFPAKYVDLFSFPSPRLSVFAVGRRFFVLSRCRFKATLTFSHPTWKQEKIESFLSCVFHVKFRIFSLGALSSKNRTKLRVLQCNTKAVRQEKSLPLLALKLEPEQQSRKKLFAAKARGTLCCCDFQGMIQMYRKWEPTLILIWTIITTGCINISKIDFATHFVIRLKTSTWKNIFLDPSSHPKKLHKILCRNLQIKPQTWNRRSFFADNLTQDASWISKWISQQTLSTKL